MRKEINLEIIYYLDTNEILTRTGIKGTVGRLYINYGFGDNYENIIKKLIKN